MKVLTPLVWHYVVYHSLTSIMHLKIIGQIVLMFGCQCRVFFVDYVFGKDRRGAPITMERDRGGRRDGKGMARGMAESESPPNPRRPAWPKRPLGETRGPRAAGPRRV